MAISFLGGLAGAGRVALTPPQPAPGHKIPSNIAFIQVVGSPLDLLFFQNWPDEIVEGLNSSFAEFNFAPATAPLAFQYMGSSWEPFVVKLIFHSGNTESIFGVDTRLTGSDEISRNLFNPILDLLRIQVNVAWCKSLALPLTGPINEQAKAIRTRATTASAQARAGNIVGAAKTLFGGGNKTTKAVNALLGKPDSDLFPPLCRVVYGGFLVLRGYCATVRVRWLPPFTPVSAHPHRAEVELTFRRQFESTDLPGRDSVRRRILPVR